MKVVFTLIVLLFFCLSAYPGLSGNEIQKRKVIVNPKADSISNYSITLNGQFNAVSITMGNSTTKNLETVGKPRNAANTIAINGEGNSVSINQNTKGGQVHIQQNGKGNRVNIS